MSAIKLQTAKDRLAAYMDAELRILDGQEYEIGGRKLKRADLEEVQKGIAMWENVVGKLQRGGIRVKRAIPLDI